MKFRAIATTLAAMLLPIDGLADDADACCAKPPSDWCPPDGPRMEKHPSDWELPELGAKPGWVILSMHVRPGAVPVSNVRVWSEAGGSWHARVWMPLVRQWVGCASNSRETNVRAKFQFVWEGSNILPGQEAFGLHAFVKPVGAPKLPSGDWGIGVCPIQATLELLQPGSDNKILNLESKGGAPVEEWLKSVVPDREYMIPNPKGNRVDFDCKIENGVVSFYDQ